MFVATLASDYHVNRRDWLRCSKLGQITLLSQDCLITILMSDIVGYYLKLFVSSALYVLVFNSVHVN